MRIPREVRETMEKIKDVNWKEEIRRMVIERERVMEEAKRRLFEDARELRSRMKSSEITEMIREDRDAR